MVFNVCEGTGIMKPSSREPFDLTPGVFRRQAGKLVTKRPMLGFILVSAGNVVWSGGYVDGAVRWRRLELSGDIKRLAAQQFDQMIIPAGTEVQFPKVVTHTMWALEAPTVQ